jgi:hypothetical protein
VVLVRHHLAGNAQGIAVLLAEIASQPDAERARGQLTEALAELGANLAVKAFGAGADEALARFAAGFLAHEHDLIGDDHD